MDRFLIIGCVPVVALHTTNRQTWLWRCTQVGLDNESGKETKPEAEKKLRTVLGRIAKLAAPDVSILAWAFLFLALASFAELGIPYLVSRCLVTATEVSLSSI